VIDDLSDDEEEFDIALSSKTKDSTTKPNSEESTEIESKPTDNSVLDDSSDDKEEFGIAPSNKTKDSTTKTSPEEGTEIESKPRNKDESSDEELDCGGSAEKKSTKDAILSGSKEATTLTRKLDEEATAEKETSKYTWYNMISAFSRAFSLSS
jgi:hypothetical protein